MPVPTTNTGEHLVFCRKHNYYFAFGDHCPVCYGEEE